MNQQMNRLQASCNCMLMQMLGSALILRCVRTLHGEEPIDQELTRLKAVLKVAQCLQVWA